ncbi:type 2 periplasmic-binding domain-containing protein [Nonomuraea recticatena]|uniref:Sugar ABC transporter substrate-binding protein n=1 Tax=Nonomuraea recticatena TaxID=46178 RepID=A0ABN3T5A2_9ACTN
MSSPMSRRGFLGLALAGVTVAGLSACGGEGGGAAGVKKGGAELSKKLVLPTFTAAKIPTPDLPVDAGQDPAYLKYPTELIKSVATPPGDGKKITSLTQTWDVAPPSTADNAYLQELNKALGSEWSMNIVVGDGYPDKFNAIIASDDLPDLVWFPPNQGLQRVPELLAAKFHDLTPYLTGDAIKKYPNLANLGDVAWKSAVTDGRLHGVAVTYSKFGQVFCVNQDYWQPVGGATFTSADDFLEKTKQLLDVKKNKYPLEPSYVNHVHMFSQWYGAPNIWRLEGGKLTHWYETPEYLAAVELAVKAFKAKLFWPDPALATIKDKVANGQIGAYVESFPGFINDAKTQKYNLGVIVPFAATPTSKPVHNAGLGSVGFTAISNKVDKARIETLLGVLNYLAAPFGTEEYQLVNFGVEGTHFTNEGGDLVFTDKGKAEVPTTWQPLSFVMNAPSAQFVPGQPERTKLIHEVQTKIAPLFQERVTTGHFSDAYTQKIGELTTMSSDTIVDFVTGRKPLSEWKSFVKKYMDKGGAAMKAEYEASIAKG